VGPSNFKSPWLDLSVEQLKDVKDRMKLMNDINEQEHRQKEIEKKQAQSVDQNQLDYMKDTLPFLDRG
jgi:hypothetical protein